MAQTVQILRASPPGALLPGVLSVELGAQTKLWVGAAAGNRLLLSSDPVDTPVALPAYLKLTGGTLTGPLVLSADPTLPLGAATKAYTDAADALKAPLVSPVFTGDPKAPTPPTGDNDTSIATTAFVKAQNYVTGGPYLPLIGGTLTGDLTIGEPWPTLYLTKPVSGTGAQIVGSTGLNLRWILELGDNAAEGGGNAGSDFALWRYTDAGASIDRPFWISRATGAATFTSTVLSLSYGTTGQFRMAPSAAGTGYGSMWRNDGASTYLLLTNNNDPTGGYNSLRPFAVNDATGLVTLGNSAAVTGTLNVSGATTLASTLNVSGATTLASTLNVSAAAQFSGALGVSGQLTAGGLTYTNSLYVVTTATVQGTLAVSGAVTLSSTLNVSGQLSAGGLTYTNSLYVVTGATINGLVISTGAQAGYQFYSRDNAGQNWTMSADGGYFHFGNNSAGGFLSLAPWALYPYSDNSVYCGNTGFAWAEVMSYQYLNPSDIKDKTDIEPLPDCLGLVTALDPKRFRFTNGPEEGRGTTHWGFIAQDVGQVMRDAGHSFGGHRDDPKGQSISYHELTAVLWKACQELALRVSALEKA